MGRSPLWLGQPIVYEKQEDEDDRNGDKEGFVHLLFIKLFTLTE
jgi:hypothetical protein